MPSKPKIVIIVGPTGVGKSAVAVRLALKFGGEIINADAMQVYRHLDIGTAKPTPEERQGVPHHLMDIVNPDEDFNASLFAGIAGEKIREITERGRAVFVAGGTGLYIKALTKGLFKGPGADPELRRQYRERAEQFGIAALHRELREKDPEAARRIHPNDTVRIIRALEIFDKIGESITGKQDAHGFSDEPYTVLKIGLAIDREELYDRINRRCRDMILRGLVREVEALLRMGYSEELKPMQALGYKQIVRLLRGQCDLEAALEDMMKETRRYAKRQLTWFRADRLIEWHHPDELKAIEESVARFYSRPVAQA